MRRFLLILLILASGCARAGYPSPLPNSLIQRDWLLAIGGGRRFSSPDAPVWQRQRLEVHTALRQEASPSVDIRFFGGGETTRGELRLARRLLASGLRAWGARDRRTTELADALHEASLEASGALLAEGLLVLAAFDAEVRSFSPSGAVRLSAGAALRTAFLTLERSTTVLLEPEAREPMRCGTGAPYLTLYSLRRLPTLVVIAGAAPHAVVAMVLDELDELEDDP